MVVELDDVSIEEVGPGFGGISRAGLEPCPRDPGPGHGPLVQAGDGEFLEDEGYAQPLGDATADEIVKHFCEKARAEGVVDASG